ncbi:MAG TPA: hypothetical protein VGF97_11280 [Rhizomicrobium sp.]|jgi:localization factor PodJL
MQPELPWNVAGIPPEAREAARAAARREGLSVGEWLTRRILRSLTDASEAAREAWRTNGVSNPRGSVEDALPTSAQDSADMLARVSRSENETQVAYNRIEEQLKSVSRRLDQNERSQSENSRAMSKAATEINIATREQAQAFDQLGTHVVGLNERLARLEQHVAAEGSRDAVKALHQGLSRLADQIAETAKNSAGQTEQLASNIETIVGKLAESRGDAEQSWQALDERVAALAANVGSLAGKLLESRGDAEHASRAIDERIAATSRTIDERISSIGERVRGVEQAAQSSAAALGKTLEGIESAQAAHKQEEEEVRRQAAALSQVSESLDGLAERFAANDARQTGTLARLEEQVARLEAKGSDPAIERRLQGIEHALGDIAERLERSEHADRSNTIEENMRGLVARLDDAEKRQRDDVTEMRAALKAQAEAVPPSPPPAPVASFDLPPFPETRAAEPQPAPPPPPPAPPPPVQPAAQVRAAEPVAPVVEPAPAPAMVEPAPVVAPPPPPVPDDFPIHADQHIESPGPESFLAAARRTARAASANDAGPAARSSLFAWVSGETHRDRESSNNNTRIALIAGIAILVIGAIAASVFLSRGVATAPPAVQATAATPPTAALASAPQSSINAAPSPGDTASASASAPPDTSHVASTQTPESAVPAQAVTQPAQPRAAASQHDRLAALADGGNSKAEELLGLQYLDGEGVAVNEAEAAKWLERAASQGEAVAAYRLGTLYERGHGVPADAAKAVQWYGVAAKAGNRKAMHNLAVAYAQGAGAEKNLTSAAQWFSRAAELGLADSEFNLAVLYERGMGVPQNLTDAYKWYAIAAAQGDTESKARIDALATQLSAGDKSAAEKAAADFHPRALDHAANNPPDASMLVRG